LKSRDEIVAILQQLQPAFRQQYHLDTLALFGSVARNQHTDDSDVDLLVTFDQSPGLAFFDLEAELSLKLGVKVDLIPRLGVKPHYWQRIAPDVVEIPFG
jgi:uncharacterized protein